MTATDAYPEGFFEWPEARRNAFFADEARKVREKQINGNGQAKIFDPDDRPDASIAPTSPNSAHTNGKGFGSFGSAKDRRFSETEWLEPKPLPMASCPWLHLIRDSCLR